MPWTCTIEKVDNEYLIEYEGENGIHWHVIEEDEVDPLKEHEELVWWLMEYFNFLGSKHQERLRIVREKPNE